MNSEIAAQIDGIDREILRALQKRRPLVSRTIARSIGISSVAVMPRLSRLKTLGIVKVSKKAKMRTFKRIFGKKEVVIRSPRSVHWDFNLEEEKR